MIRKRKIPILRLLILLWFLLTPVFWQMDISKVSSGAYDAFDMAPFAVIHLVCFYALALLELYSNKPSLFLLLLLVFYFPLIQLSNYPYLTYRDVYLHAAPTETILSGGHLVYAKDPAPASWPIAFDLNAITSIIFGTDLIVTNYILYFAMILSFALILYLFAARLELEGYRLAGYGAVLFLCLFSNQFFDFNHFSRSGLGFFFLLLFLASFVFFEGITGVILQLLSAVAIVATHPFVSFAMVAFALSYSIFAKKNKRFVFTLGLITVVISWFIFIGTTTFQQAVDLTKTFLTPGYVSQLEEVAVTNATSPWWSAILRDSFKYSLGFLFVVAIISSFWIIRNIRKGRESKKIHVALFSILNLSLVMLMSLILLPDWGITRFTAFAAFPAAFSSFVLLDNLFPRKKWPRFGRLLEMRTIKVAFLCFIMILSAAVTVLKFERNYYYGDMTHPQELSSLSFFFKYDRNSTVDLLSWHTTVYSAYFNVLSHQTLRLWYKDIENFGGNISRVAFSLSESINKSHAVITGMRDQYDLVGKNSSQLLETVDQTMISPYFDAMYSNGNYVIYSRP